MAEFIRVGPNITSHISRTEFNPGDAEQNVRDIPPIIVDIINFVNSHSEKIKVIDEDLEGGWEGWLQVELALLHNEYSQPLALSNEYSVEREVPTYIEPRQKIDLWYRSNQEFFGDDDDKNVCVRCRDSGADHPRIGIELKCFTSYKDYWTGTARHLQAEVLADIMKIQNMHPVFTKACGARVFAVGVTQAEGDLCGYTQALTLGNIPVQYAMTMSDGIFVIWWYKDFPRVID